MQTHDMSNLIPICVLFTHYWSPSYLCYDNVVTPFRIVYVYYSRQHAYLKTILLRVAYEQFHYNWNWLNQFNWIIFIVWVRVCVLRLPNRFSSLIQDTNRHPNQQIVRALLMVCCFQIQKKKYSWQLCASDVWMTIDMISSKCVYLYLFWIFFFYLLQ